MKIKNLYIHIFVFSLMIILFPVFLSAEVVSGFDQPDTGYVSNVVVDIIEHNGGVWFATGEGLNYSFDNGQTWLSYDSSNGLVSNNISAIYSIPTFLGQRIWIASNHDQRISGELMAISDGLSYSDDNGNTWKQINFDSLNIPYVWGGDRSIFDITGYFDPAQPDDNWLFFTAFAGGFLASRDGGMSWRRIYPSVSDSIQFNTPTEPPSLRNRYFSCAADTSHGDSLFIWAGTAGGFFQYIFAPPREKPFSKRINTIVFCNNCSGGDSNFVYFGGNKGFTRGLTTGAPFISRFESDGLPGSFVTAIIDFGGKLFVGTKDTVSGNSTGLAVSTDFGDSFSPLSSFTEVVGQNRTVSDFAVIRNRLYLAAEEAGLFVSNDSGNTWNKIYVDSSDTSTANRRNVVYALNAWDDTLRVGTDSGLVQLYLNPSGHIDSSRFFVFGEGAFSSTKVIRIKTQVFDSTDVIWTINRPVTDTGTAMVGRSANGGITWDTLQVNALTNDVNFFGDTAFVVSEAGIRFTVDSANPANFYHVKEYTSDSVVVDSLNRDTITVMAVSGDTVIFGTSNGFAISLNRGTSYSIYRVNNDTLAADAVLHYSSDIFGISGDFIPALGVQYFPDKYAIVYASNRPAYGGFEGISGGYMLPLIDTLTNDTVGYQRLWSSIYDKFAWNFSFNGDTVFAATNDGLIYASSLDAEQGVWDTLTFADSLGNPLIFPGVPVYAVQVIDSFLWVGTDDRTVRVNLNNLSKQNSYFYVDKNSPSDEVYAFPVPFSHTRDRAEEFHFVVKKDAYITLEIYDYAMNLVSRVIDNEFYPAGIYPDAGVHRRTWNGLNGNGNQVAVGMYYFKVTYSTGEVYWGKLAVIP